MAWQEINPQLLQQERDGQRMRWYRDDRKVGGGGLQLWLDDAGDVSGFQLDLEEWPSGRHYAASWRAGTPLRLGTVDSGRQSGMGMSQASLLRYGQTDPRAASKLMRYFLQNATVLDSAHQDTIAAVFEGAFERTAAAA